MKPISSALSEYNLCSSFGLVQVCLRAKAKLRGLIVLDVIADINNPLGGRPTLYHCSRILIRLVRQQKSATKHSFRLYSGAYSCLFAQYHIAIDLRPPGAGVGVMEGSPIQPRND